MQMFEEEYRKIEKSLFLVAFGFLHNTEDAKDVVQETVLSAYQNYDCLRQKEYFKTWLTRIVINKCKDFLKSRLYTEELRDDLDVFYNLKTEDLEIMDAICRLDKQAAMYITLRFYHDMTYEEVAKMLRQPLSTVKYRTTKALEKLKMILEGDTENEH